MTKLKNLLVFFGGISPEHEVSVITGLQVLNNADSQKYNVIPVYVAKSGKWYTGRSLFKAESFVNLSEIPYLNNELYIKTDEPKTAYIKTQSVLKSVLKKDTQIDVDVVFPCFHGGTGENGAFQGLFEIINVPYVGSSVLGSAVGMDKVVMKQVLQQNNINVAPYKYYYKKDWLNDPEKIIEDIENELEYPLFVKPANSGSSVGISKVTSHEKLNDALELAFVFDRKVIVETGIENFKEINISVIGISGDETIVSVCEEVFASKEFLNYEEKYVSKEGSSKGMASTKRQIPANLSKSSSERIKKIAQRAFHALNAGGLARIDFLVNEKTGDYYLIEINTIPGSMSFYLWKETKLPFGQMIDKLVEVAENTYTMNQEKTTSFPSNILKNYKASMKSPKVLGQ